MCILNSFTEIDMLYFGCMEFTILFDFHKKSQNPILLLLKNLNTPLSFTLKKAFSLLHSAPALLYSKFFKPPYLHLCDCTKRLALPVSLIIADNCNALGLIPPPAGRSISVCLISYANYGGTCKVSDLSLFVTQFR